MKKEHILALAQLTHILIVVGLIVVIGIQVHWAAGLLFLWMAVSFAGIVKVSGKNNRKLVDSVKALDRKQNQTKDEFNRFITTVNNQADALKDEINACRECQKYPGSIRPGSVHIQHAPNCQLGKNPTPVQPPKKESFTCSRCVEDGDTDGNYKNGNCPIHD